MFSETSQKFSEKFAKFSPELNTSPKCRSKKNTVLIKNVGICNPMSVTIIIIPGRVQGCQVLL